MAIYFNIDGWQRLSGQSNVQAQITANDYLNNSGRPQAAAFVGEQHISDFFCQEWAPGRICLEDSYGVFRADGLGKVDEMPAQVFEGLEEAEAEAAKLNEEEEPYNAGPEHNTSMRQTTWFVKDCDERGIPLDDLCPLCNGDSRYCRCS